MNNAHNNKILTNVGIFLLVFRMFFTTVGYLIMGYPFIEMAIFTIIILGGKINKNKMLLSIKERSGWLFFVLYILMTSIFSIEVIGTIRYSLLYLFILVTAIILDSMDGWQVIYIKLYLRFSILFCITTYLSYFFGIKMVNMISFIYTTKQINMLNLLYSRNYFSGIANQVGFTGFFISIGILILFSQTKKGCQKYSFVKIVLMLGGLILTAKRGFVIAVLISLLFMKFISLKKMNKKIIINTIKLSIFIFIVGLMAYRIFEPVKFLVKRFTDNSDFTSGRTDIYSILLELFLDRPILGNGFNSFNRYMSSTFNSAIDGHNIYLQLLAEVGLVGTALVISIFIFSLFKSIKLYLYETNSKISSYILLSIGIQIFFLIYGFVGNPIYDHQFFMTYMYGISLIFINRNSRKKVINEDLQILY